MLIKKEINIVQVKTNVSLNLPLLDDVGWALIDYIKLTLKLLKLKLF